MDSCLRFNNVENGWRDVVFFTDSGALRWVIVEIFSPQFSRWYFCSSIHTNQTASAQSSGAGGSDGSTDDESPASEVSLLHNLLQYYPWFICEGWAVIMCWICRSQNMPEDWRMNGGITVGGGSNSEASCMIRFLVKELEEHYLTAKTDMMLAARTKPIHGETSDLQLWFIWNDGEMLL